MSSATVSERPVNYINVKHTIKSWLLTGDHKRIALLYLVSVTFMFLVGGAAAGIFRVQLISPQGEFIQVETYNRLFTLHGVVMIFLFLIPSIPAILGNFLIPIMIGARDLAFPKINLLSWYLYIIAAALILYAAISGGVDTGWTFYTPYSSLYANSNVVLTVLGAFIAGFSSIFTGLNFIVTIHKMRAPGMSWTRMPAFVWAMYATSFIFILGTPVVAITLSMMAVERVWGVGLFDPALGGDPLLFQHLFWFYSHPAVYIMILPAMGVVSEIIPCFAKQRLYGYSFVVISSFLIAVIGFLVWGHHMFLTGQSIYAGIVFSFLSMIVAVPSAIKVFNWTATLYKGSVTFDAPMIFALGFIGLFLIGGLTGIYLANLGTDIHLHDTYFIVAHFHYVMVGGGVMGFLGGIHFWWPKMTGRMYPEVWARVGAALVFAGFNLTFMPQFLLGFEGMPRRYYHYPPEFQILNTLSTAGASVLAVGYALPLIYLTWSLFFGKIAPANPWGAKGLEWEKTTSPPPTHNFLETPVVTEDPYNYPMDTVPA